MELYTSLLRNKPQTFAVNIFEVTFSTKHIFDEMSCIGPLDEFTGSCFIVSFLELKTFDIYYLFIYLFYRSLYF